MSIDINFKEYFRTPLRWLLKISSLKELFKTSSVFVVVNMVSDYLVRASLEFPQTNYGVDYSFRQVAPGIILTIHDPLGDATFALPWVAACYAVGFYLLHRDDINKAAGYVYNSIRDYFKSHKVSCYNPIKPLLTEKDLEGLELERV